MPTADTRPSSRSVNVGTISSSRNHALDGIRGWAALSVVLFHVFWETFGGLFPGIRNIATALIFDGELAVYIFFVLSGEALTWNYFRNYSTRSMASLAIKRYPRLTIPVFASCLLVFILMKLDLVHSGAASIIVHSEDWLGKFLNFEPTFRNLMIFALSRVYTQGISEPVVYNNFLWTMPIELVGSILVFLTALLSAFLRNWLRSFVLLALLEIVVAPTMACFTVGMIFSRLGVDGVFERARGSARMQVLSAAVLILTALASAVANLHGARPERMGVAVATVLIGASFANRAVYGFCQNRISRFLGVLSFPLYLVHFAVIVSLTSSLILLAEARGMLDLTAALAIGGVSVAAVFGLAFLFTYVERFTGALCGRLALALLVPPPSGEPIRVHGRAGGDVGEAHRAAP